MCQFAHSTLTMASVLSPQVTDRARLHVPFFLKIGFKFITYTHTLDGHSNLPVRITVLFLKRKQKDITISMIHKTLNGEEG